jgi:pyridoxamine 5'-phosphate oxidase
MSTLTGDESLELPEFDAPPSDPLALAAAWVAAAESRGVREPRASVLATADAAGRPSSRVVLIKTIDDRGAVITTVRSSAKARAMAANPRASLTLYWRETLQQLILDGTVETLSDAQSDALFADRPRGARAASIVSTSGQPLTDEAGLIALAAALEAGSGELARPDDWGAYRIVPERIEFWHGRANRLHRRLSYQASADGWTPLRLQP